jgi:hypothetical protein
LAGAYLICELKSTTYLNLDAAYTSFLCMVTHHNTYRYNRALEDFEDKEIGGK